MSGVWPAAGAAGRNSAAPSGETPIEWEEIERALRDIFVEISAYGADESVIRSAFVEAVKARVKEALADLVDGFEDEIQGVDHEDTEPIVQSKINEFWTAYWPLGIMKVGQERYLLGAAAYEYLRRDRDRISIELVRVVIVKRVD